MLNASEALRSPLLYRCAIEIDGVIDGRCVVSTTCSLYTDRPIK